MARVYVLIAAVLFGTTGTAQALGPEIDPLAVGTARIAIGALLLVAIAVASGRFQLGGADRRLVLLWASSWPPTRPRSSRRSTTREWRSAPWWRSARRPS